MASVTGAPRPARRLAAKSAAPAKRTARAQLLLDKAHVLRGLWAVVARKRPRLFPAGVQAARNRRKAPVELGGALIRSDVIKV